MPLFRSTREPTDPLVADLTAALDADRVRADGAQRSLAAHDASVFDGGVAGPGSVAGANLANNASATDAEVVTFTPSDAEAAFEAVTAANISGATFVEDGLIPDDTGPWFRFDFLSNNLVANPEVTVELNGTLVSSLERPDKVSGFIAIQRAVGGRVAFSRVSLAPVQ